jgi:beta-phosphoglucomutase-like phosphatase (HAD superfamily)
LSPEDREKVRQARAIIFDCDGTLVDSMPVHYLAWHETMSRYGILFPEDRFYSLGGMPSHRIVELLANEQAVMLEAERVAHEKERAFLDRMSLLTPIQTVIDVAQSCRGVIPIAVASGGFRDIIRKQLDQLGITQWFDAIVTAEDTVRHKPEPDVFLEAARRLGVSAVDCLVFEDADLGVEAAARAKMKCIDVRTFYTPRRMSVAGK